jgi:beta-glucosidase
VLEAWYGGSKGADAVANLLFGDVNPSGKLPMTFPLHEVDLPRTTVAQPPAPVRNGTLSFKVDYNLEGARVGYKWFATEHKPVLFPFGFGLSYTRFAYSGLKAAADGTSVTLTVKNTGTRKGAEVTQVYATLPESAGENWARLVGWQKLELAPGESRTLTVPLNQLTMSVWDEAGHKWMRPGGRYRVQAGRSSADLPLEASFTIAR